MRFWVPLTLLLLSCADDARSLAAQLNRCSQQFECTRGTCNPELGICVQPRGATRPYDYRVQITPPSNSDAGVLSAARTERATLTDAGELGTITLEPATFVRGSVRSIVDVPIEAELVFTPRGDSLSLNRSAFTQPRGQEGQAFRVALEANRGYDVQVYPRGPDSLRFPPYAFELTTGVDEQVATFTYPELVPFPGEIRDENDLPAPRGARIKTRYRDRLLASSSIGTVGDAGTFEVQLPRSVLDAGAEHELALDLSEVTVPQNVQIAFDMARAPSAGPWVMPVLPKPVPLTGTVEIADLANDDTFSAQLTFVSEFPVPPGTNDMGDADWCQLRRPGMPQGTFRCTANVAQYSPDLRFEVVLLPGEYRITIAPAGAAVPAQRLALGTGGEIVTRRPLDDPQQGPTLLQLDPATLFDITVTSPTPRPMPSVIVSANALGLRADDLPEVALRNRSDSARTLHDGKAELAVDVGVYDLVAAPPDGSGYAWVLEYNRQIERPDPWPAGSVDRRPYTLLPQLPVVLKGSAVSAGGIKLEGADVDAYAMVPDLRGGPDRAVRITHTTTDRDGEFALQMPPRIGQNDDPESDAGVADAGADAQR